MDREKIIKIGFSKLNQVFDPEFTYEDFCKLIYKEAGYELVYSEQPYISYDDLFSFDFSGYVLFLKHKKYQKSKKKKNFSHIGIIFPNGSFLHYSKNFNKVGKREVLLTPLTEVFKVYDLVIKIKR